ncbi:hypothetical protein MSG28_013145 [Choristoneura fumiferana]|uniref:Uncharacterized protein n=1 Tax=Choristoneura fumiferana TaxID=7141 RepID=A0ACC0KSN4_CHOFU|nr:hypothetical protein MSG28_013145 [Choristoneura fumiferana]
MGETTSIIKPPPKRQSYRSGNAPAISWSTSHDVQPPRRPRDYSDHDLAANCHYSRPITSRVLDSTARYVRFVRKLRALEEEQRKGNETKHKELTDKQYSDFFIKCDRKSLINNVARRVDLCLASYEADLQKKRERLTDLFAREEEADIRKFVEQAQAGAESIWQDKQARLAQLLAARQKEHEEKYKDTPLSKCVHVLPCIVKLRAKECEEVQLYQMKEKAARRAAEKEFDKMWNAVAMKESEALAARMEYDVIERVRRDMECLKYSEQQLAQRVRDRERERERLKQEALYFRQLWDADIKKEEEAERKRTEQRLQTARERDEMIKERKETVARHAAEAKLIGDTWDSLAGQGLAAQLAKEELRKRKERDLDECNRKMIELRGGMAAAEAAGDVAINEVAKVQQEIVDRKRCEYLSWSQKTNREVRKAMVDQIQDRRDAREQLKQRLAEQDDYHRQLFGQLQQLAAHKDVTDAQARKQHQRNLLQQIEYNKLLKVVGPCARSARIAIATTILLANPAVKQQCLHCCVSAWRERALQEEKDQIRKCQLATEEYNQEISRMLSRPFFSDELHPFMKPMARGLAMRAKCPCSRPDYCANCKGGDCK